MVGSVTLNMGIGIGSEYKGNYYNSALGTKAAIEWGLWQAGPGVITLGIEFGGSFSNGGYFDENITSLNFNSHAMGFFGGLVAIRMTKTNQVGIIAAYEWQAEIEGYYEGVKYQDPTTRVHVNFVNDWNNKDAALSVYE